MSEVGTGAQLRAAFPSAAAFCSWLGLCPDTRITGGKVLQSKTGPVKSRLALAFRMAAQAVGRSHRELGRFAMRMRGRLGKAEGITATPRPPTNSPASSTACSFPAKRTMKKAAFQLTPAKAARALHDLQRRAQTLGFQLVAAV